MEDFKKMIKLTWMRYKLWIVILSLFVILLNGLNIRKILITDTESFKESVSFMADNLNRDDEIKDYKKIDNNYLNSAESIASDFKDKYDLKTKEELESKSDLYFDRLSKMQLYDMDGIYQNYLYISNNFKNGSLDISNYLYKLLFPILFVSFLISMIITSVEKSMPHYEFNMMLPWHKRDEVIMKSILIFILSLGLFIISSIISIFLIHQSNFGSLSLLIPFLDTILKMIIFLLATSIIFVSSGEIAGNFLGHIGVMFVIIGAFNLVATIIQIFLLIFSGVLSNEFIENFLYIRDGFSPFTKTFVSIMNVDIKNYGSLIAYLIISILWAIYAYIINKFNSAEKSGYMVFSGVMNKICYFLGIFSLTSIIFAIASNMFYNDINVIINLIIYIISFMISLKLFKLLFNIRLKF